MEWQMPIIHVLTTGGLGDPAEINAFNYFFSLMVAMAFLLFIFCAGVKVLTRS